MLALVPDWAPEEEKAAGWQKEDEAREIEERSRLFEVDVETLLQRALSHDAGCTEAHAGLAERYQALHSVAERKRKGERAAGFERRLRGHVAALPEGHAVRSQVSDYLRGDGALTIHTDVPGAEVELFRYELQNRRLVAVPVRVLGRTPLVEERLPMGSYLCLLRHPERAEVRYPVHVGRAEHWDGVPPGGGETVPVRLPQQGELGPDDCLMPAGWYWSGGDAQAPDSLERRRLWCDEVVVKRYPVTNREYLAFLDDLVAVGRHSDAARYQPTERTGAGGTPIFGQDDSGRFVLRPEAEGVAGDLDWPVVFVDWFGASAYAAWHAARTGKPWRLTGEFEWEKAARGVDGRFYPWGNRHDPSWCCTRSSHTGRGLAGIDSFPVDISAYGVRGLGGNVQDWCADVFRKEGQPLGGDQVAPPTRHDPGAEPTSPRVRRGGSWGGTARVARSAFRLGFAPTLRLPYLGLRLAMRPEPEPDRE